jgi:hypothetical protein
LEFGKIFRKRYELSWTNVSEIEWVKNDDKIPSFVVTPPRLMAMLKLLLTSSRLVVMLKLIKNLRAVPVPATILEVGITTFNF